MRSNFYVSQHARHQRLQPRFRFCYRRKVLKGSLKQKFGIRKV